MRTGGHRAQTGLSDTNPHRITEASGPGAFAGLRTRTESRTTRDPAVLTIAHQPRRPRMAHAVPSTAQPQALARACSTHSAHVVALQLVPPPTGLSRASHRPRERLRARRLASEPRACRRRPSLCPLSWHMRHRPRPSCGLSHATSTRNVHYRDAAIGASRLGPSEPRIVHASAQRPGASPPGLAPTGGARARVACLRRICQLPRCKIANESDLLPGPCAHGQAVLRGRSMPLGAAGSDVMLTEADTRGRERPRSRYRPCCDCPSTVPRACLRPFLLRQRTRRRLAAALHRPAATARSPKRASVWVRLAVVRVMLALAPPATRSLHRAPCQPQRPNQRPHMAASPKGGKHLAASRRHGARAIAGSARLETRSPMLLSFGVAQAIRSSATTQCSAEQYARALRAQADHGRHRPVGGSSQSTDM